MHDSKNSSNLFFSQIFTVHLKTSESIRLDVYLSEILNTSRSQVEALIKKDRVFYDNKLIQKGGLKVEEGGVIGILELEDDIKKQHKEVDFDIEILYEDDDILILNKPPNLIIHDAPSHKEVTLVDWLKSRGFCLSTLSGEERYGIVHRLDKDTSGVIIIAKSNFAHQSLANQLKDRSMGRYYLAIIEGGLKESICVECHLGRNPKNRLKMSKLDVAKYPNARYAKTLFTPLLDAKIGAGALQLIGAQLFTGRTHQIRAHLESISRHIISDPIYGHCKKLSNIPGRIMLHAFILYLIHPKTKTPLLFKAPIFNDMLEYMQQNFNKDYVDVLLDKDPHTFLSL